MSFFSDKVVVITGGSEGIGKALVEHFMQEGASDCRNFINSVIDTFGAIDILINNAGISMRALFKETDLETLRALIDVNLWGTIYCTRFAIDEIIKTKGTIVGISSVAGFRGLPGRTGYSASKFAVTGFLEALRTEMLDEGVNVMWVFPGFTTSNIRNVALNKDAKPQEENPMDESKMMSAEECASRIAHAIEKRKRTLLLTGIAHQTSFMSKFFPFWADTLIKRFYFKNGKLVK
jgi:short-subunit dehydrogenase